MRVLTLVTLALIASTAIASAQPGRSGGFATQQGPRFGQTQMLQHRFRVDTATQTQTQARTRAQLHVPGTGLNWQAPDPARLQLRQRLQLQTYDGLQLGAGQWAK